MTTEAHTEADKMANELMLKARDLVLVAMAEPAKDHYDQMAKSSLVLSFNRLAGPLRLVPYVGAR